jgi:hypothetical protein
LREDDFAEAVQGRLASARFDEDFCQMLKMYIHHPDVQFLLYGVMHLGGEQILKIL